MLDIHNLSIIKKIIFPWPESPSCYTPWHADQAARNLHNMKVRSQVDVSENVTQVKEPRYTLFTGLGGSRVDVATKGNITVLLGLETLTSSSATTNMMNYHRDTL